MSQQGFEKLFKPIKIGSLNLAQRAVMAPMTRLRASPEHVPTQDQLTYYSQRAIRPGTLIISEATYISAKAVGQPQAPGIWTQDHIDGWKKVIDEVHSKKSYFFLQLWAMGRLGWKQVLDSEGQDYVSSSAIKLEEMDATPRSLTTEEVKQYVKDYAQAAKNAVAAGADGVEIHGANGYLIDQFLHENSNTRTDEYGGSIANRARFGLEIVDAVVDAVGAERTAIRLSPWGTYGDMGTGVGTVPQFSYFVAELEKRGLEGKRLAYIHTMEPREAENTVPSVNTNNFIRDTWTGKWMRCGSLTHNEAFLKEILKDDNTLAAFARHFASNPDLIDRLEKGTKLSDYNRDLFFVPGEPKGYVDYSYADGTVGKVSA